MGNNREEGHEDSGGAIQWTEPYTFFTTGDPGITASVMFTDPEGQD